MTLPPYFIGRDGCTTWNVECPDCGNGYLLTNHDTDGPPTRCGFCGSKVEATEAVECPTCGEYDCEVTDDSCGT